MMRFFLNLIHQGTLILLVHPLVVGEGAQDRKVELRVLQLRQDQPRPAISRKYITSLELF